MPTLETLQRSLTRRLELAGITPAGQEVRALLMHVLKLDWSGLVLAGGRVLTLPELERVEALIARRLTREPLQHLIGAVEWGGLQLKVTPAALIPRPETETLLQLALEALSGRTAPAVLDVGTGSGALALGIKAARPAARVTATDLSAEALALARQNAETLHLEMTFQEADLLHGVPGTFDLIVSNPPYLPEADEDTAEPELRHDPRQALYSGPDGLTLARQLAQQASALLNPGAVLLLELDPRNVEQLAHELRLHGWQVRIHPDLTGRLRFLEASSTPQP
ncbi:peptide chain release factor N(5)-glutamine methyltransferase [Deinococcus sp. KNUC1210]|nr:peptide chain release factor N(5)-glutamine methyltransferase [Deinococcus sp. KNUC1210]ULH16861.1 peptide chain release factor N(5)-glutamine methyltransferase [Deinococcus sp. KNUC1210]